MRLKQFLGINNVADPTRLEPGEMTAATNVDIGSKGSLLSRRGRTLLTAGAARCVYQSPFGIFTLIDDDLVLLDANGTVLRTVYTTLGCTRVWYVLLPDGRVGFSNGLIQGVASATETRAWGIPAPEDAGTGAPGDTLYQINYVRASDGREGPPTNGELIDTTQAILNLPTLAGHSINVYFAPYGEDMFLAGNTFTDTFLHDGGQLSAPFKGATLTTPPIGTQLTAWNSRILLVEDNVLWATRPFQYELCDPVQDFVQLPEAIRLVYGNSDGIFVGTGNAMYFLAGTALHELKSERIATGAAALGSSVEVPLSYLPKDAQPNGSLRGALCLFNGEVHLLHGAGQIQSLTADRYRTDATEVHATVRLRDGVMQYLAAPV